jgi:hypothetical protein
MARTAGLLGYGKLIVKFKVTAKGDSITHIENYITVKNVVTYTGSATPFDPIQFLLPSNA